MVLRHIGMSKVAIDYNNPVALRKAGIEALAKELGSLGMAQFMLQYDTGYGDYTEQREELLQAPFSQILQQGLKEYLGV